ncbi:MAG TPA: M48 family metallopeptidase [Bryobacteraceae bacterium]|jgi:predicted Zn-dependent protease|nr:M48 family metallopeptidase [Bryobacteraceae bacterium]
MGLRINPRLIIGLLIALGSLFTYFTSRQYNPITDETQHVAISPRQEIALGLQAAPQMAAQHGGISSDERARALVDRVGRQVVARSAASKSPYRFEFHLLADPETINAFALPGGQVFITEGLLRRLGSEGQLAGVLGHEVGHVVARHSAEHMAKQRLTEGLTGAAVLATYDPSDPRTMRNAAVAALIANMVNMKFGRDDEIEADRLGVKFMAEGGYDPRAMIGVMEVLAKATGGNRQPEFFSTHPNPERRMERIQEAIRREFPQGVPSGLKS